jgi:hypothetical protein
MPFDVKYKLSDLHLTADDDPDFEDVVNDPIGEMSTYYPQSLKNTYTRSVTIPGLERNKEDKRRGPIQTLSAGNYTWVGPEGRMLRVEDDRIVESFSGNMYDMPKLYAVAETPNELKQMDNFKSIPFFTGFVKPFILTEMQYLSLQSDYENYDYLDYAELSEEDIGEVFFELVDGHHRSIGAILSGDPYVYAEVTPPVYGEYLEWVSSGRQSDHESLKVFKYLDENLM